MKMRAKFKCGSCGHRWVNPKWVVWLWEDCPACGDTMTAELTNWWHPLFQLHHALVGSRDWVTYFAFVKLDRWIPFRKWFDYSYHCKYCFFFIVLLRVTVYPILALGDYLQPFIPKGLVNVTRNS